MLSTLKHSAAMVAHFLDHPATIRAAEKAVPLVYPTGAALLMGRDLYKAEGGEEKLKVALRDALVLGATVAGTLYGTKWLMHEAHEFAPRGLEALKNLKGSYSGDLQAKLKTMLSKEHEQVGFQEFRQAFRSMWSETQTRLKSAASEEEKVTLLKGLRDDIQEVFPLSQEGEESFVEQLKKAAAFFGVGAISVGSGVAGGLVANALNGGGSEVKVNIFKEAAFQFIANIALCAIGASLGLLTVNTLKSYVNPIFNNRLFRIPIVSAGLSLGIVGGGFIANFLGRVLINPVCDWMDSADRSIANLKERLSEGWNRKGNSRRIEFSDVILHLDDLPTALAIAGMKVMGPFIPPFFAFSGYRAGIGYRNKPEHGHGGFEEVVPAFTSRPTQPSRLMAQNTVFSTFYEQQRGLAIADTRRYG
jgi:hypothetical protein